MGYSAKIRHLATKRHCLTDGHGLPLSVVISAGSVHDSRQALPTIDRVKVGNKSRPTCLTADKAYDSRALRAALRKRGIRASIPERQFSNRHRRGRPPLKEYYERILLH